MGRGNDLETRVVIKLGGCLANQNFGAERRKSAEFFRNETTLALHKSFE